VLDIFKQLKHDAAEFAVLFEVIVSILPPTQFLVPCDKE